MVHIVLAISTILTIFYIYIDHIWANILPTTCMLHWLYLYKYHTLHPVHLLYDPQAMLTQGVHCTHKLLLVARSCSFPCTVADPDGVTPSCFRATCTRPSLSGVTRKHCQKQTNILMKASICKMLTTQNMFVGSRFYLPQYIVILRSVCL